MNILHKLGLYRASEVNELISKTAALTESVDGVIEEAKYNDACYKTAIKVIGNVECAIQIVKAHCTNTVCTVCSFNKPQCEFADACIYNTVTGCKFDGDCEYKPVKKCALANVPPCLWEVSK